MKAPTKKKQEHVLIQPWTPQWNAWLKFYEGSRTADLMLKSIAYAAASVFINREGKAR